MAMPDGWRLRRMDSSPSEISISDSCDSSSSSMSFFTLRMSMGPSVLSVKACDGGVQRQQVSLRAEAADHALGDGGEIGMAAKRLPGVDVRQVDLDEGNPDRGEGVAHGDAGMAVGRRVDDHVAHPGRGCTLDQVDQFALVVGLPRIYGDAGLACRRGQRPVDVAQGVAAVVARLATAEKVEVGAVENQDVGHQGARSKSSRELSGLWPFMSNL